MDIKYIESDFQFIYRVSAIIYNSSKTKILLFYGTGRDFYMLPGGKVKMYETSEAAIKREIEEELGYINLEFNLVGISEEFANAKGYNNHQINFIFDAIYHGKSEDTDFRSNESDWINFKWINIDELSNYNIYPKNIKNIVNSKDIIHIVDYF